MKSPLSSRTYIAQHVLLLPTMQNSVDVRGFDTPRQVLMAARSIGDSLIDRLDETCVAAIVHHLSSACELSAASQACVGLWRACTDEAETRCRALIQQGWDYTCCMPRRRDRYDKVWGAHGDCAEMVSCAARRAGGWTALLAGREGLLDTYVKGPSGDLTTTFRGGISSWLIIWDISNDEEGLVWSGIAPLAHHLRRPGRSSWSTYLLPDGDGLPLLPGGQEDIGRPCHISGPLGDLRTWRMKPSIFGDGFSESSLHPLYIDAQDFALFPPHGAGSVLGGEHMPHPIREDAMGFNGKRLFYHYGGISAGLPTAKLDSPYYEILLWVSMPLSRDPAYYHLQFRLEVPSTLRTWRHFAQCARREAVLRRD